MNGIHLIQQIHLKIQKKRFVNVNAILTDSNDNFWVVDSGLYENQTFVRRVLYEHPLMIQQLFEWKDELFLVQMVNQKECQMIILN